MFSYLPAGTPPWPTVVPQLPSSSKVATANPLAATSATQEAKPKRSASSVLVAAAVLVLIPILGAVATLGILYSRGDFPPHATPRSQAAITLPKATPTANPATTPGAAGANGNNATPQAQGNQLPNPSSFSQASDKDLNISFKYPSDWQAETPSKTNLSVTLDYHPQQAFMDFRATHYSASASSNFTSASELNQAALQSIITQNSGTNVQKVNIANPQPSIGGTNWTEDDITYVDSGGTKVHVLLASVQHENNYYRILIFTVDDFYSEAQTKYIQPMLASVQFLS